MRIEVTESDIERGKKSSTKHCPVARACSRALGHQFEVSVTGSEVAYHHISGLTNRVYKVLPHEVMTKIALFDNDHGMAPFEFEI